MSTISFSILVLGILVLGILVLGILVLVIFVVAIAFDRLRDPLYPAQSGIPRRADRRQLGGRTGELRLVDPVVALSTCRFGANQTDPVQDGQMLRYRLA